VSIEIWQFPRAASRDELAALLKSLGYTRGENLFFPGPAGTLSFFWSEPRDFLSTSGVDASVFPLDADGKKTWNTQNDWGLRTRTSISASSFDQEFQNKTVRAIRKAFGGTFYNDHFGKNRYTVVQPTKSTPASRGIPAFLVEFRRILGLWSTSFRRSRLRCLVLRLAKSRSRMTRLAF